MILEVSNTSTLNRPALSGGCFIPAIVLFISMGLISSCEKHIETPELDGLVSSLEKEYLLSELSRIDPPERIRDLSGYSASQLEMGGGFYGLLPDQLTDADSIPLPDSQAGRLEAALHLARQRKSNLEALEKLNPEYKSVFTGEPLADFLEGAGLEPAEDDSRDGIRLLIDMSALTGFFEALGDDEIDESEAGELAALPSNQAMLEHRRNLGYVPEPLPDTESLAKMIRIAGSSDPLDRLWVWVNSQNAFGYADLVQNSGEYEQFLSDLASNGEDLENVVSGQIDDYVPEGFDSEVRFAFTVGWAIRGWATPDMVGLNIEQSKDYWDDLLGTLIEESYHRLQIELCPTTSGEVATEFSDLVTADTGDKRYDKLYEILTYCMLEGVANRVRGQFAAEDLEQKTPLGADLLNLFVRQVLEQGDLESADALISEGLKNNGPLYGLGWKTASLIEETGGSRAVAEYQGLGPAHFFLRGAALSKEKGNVLLAPETMSAISELKSMLD